MKAWWYGGSGNWGDEITPVFIHRLTGIIPEQKTGPGSILSVGSILHLLQENDIVWGSGIISPLHVPNPYPKNVYICAVRGPETRRILMELGGKEIPEIYGDPALLTPYFFKVEDPEPLWDIGVILHIHERGCIGIPDDLSIRFIDICGGIEQVIKDVVSCKAIISSSLHGIVLGDAYNLPVAWLQIDEGNQLVGGSFKFIDYFLSTKRDPIFTPVTKGSTLNQDLIKWLPSPDIDLSKLFGVCPFSKFNNLSDIPSVPIRVEKNDISFQLDSQTIYENPCRFSCTSEKNIVKVEYRAEDWLIGVGTNRENNFMIEYDFSVKGRRVINALGYSPDGRIIARAHKEIIVQ